MIVLDTDVLIEIFDKESERGDEVLEKIVESGENISITAINLHEILYGLRKYARPVKEVLQLPVLSYAMEDASLSAKLELEMERRGTPIRGADAMIAAVAINNGASLYTLDLKHFQPLKTHGLKLFHQLVSKQPLEATRATDLTSLGTQGHMRSGADPQLFGGNLISSFWIFLRFPLLFSQLPGRLLPVA